MKKKIFFGALIGCVLGMSGIVFAEETDGEIIGTGIYLLSSSVSSGSSSSSTTMLQGDDLAVGERKEEILTELPLEFGVGINDETSLLVQQKALSGENYLYESLVKKGVFTKEKVDEIMDFYQKQMKIQQELYEAQKDFSEEQKREYYQSHPAVDSLTLMIEEGIITGEQKNAINQYYQDQMMLGIQAKAEEHTERYRSEAILTQAEAKAVEAFYIDTRFNLMPMPKDIAPKNDTKDLDQIKAIVIPKVPEPYRPKSVLEIWLDYYAPLVENGVLTKEKVEAMVNSDTKAVEKYKTNLLKEVLTALVEEKQLTAAKKEMVLQFYQNRQTQYLKVREKKQTKDGIEYSVSVTQISTWDQMLAQGLITKDESTLLNERCGFSIGGFLSVGTSTIVQVNPS